MVTFSPPSETSTEYESLVNEIMDNNGMDTTSLGADQHVPAWAQTLIDNQRIEMQSQRQEFMSIIEQQSQQIRGMEAHMNETPRPFNIKRPRPKLSDDHEKFDGEDLSLYPQFRGKLEAKVEIDAEAIGTEKDRVWFAFHRLTGTAAARIYPWISTFKNTPFFTLPGYFKQMDIAFLDPSLRDKALSKLNTLQQGNRSFSELVSEFDRLLLEAGGHGWDDLVKKGYLKASFNQTLCDRLVTVEEKDTYEDFCHQVKGVADRLAEYRRFTNGVKGPRNLGNTASATTNGAASVATGDSMDWEPSTSRATRPPKRNAARAKWVTKGELDKRRENGLCLRCGAGGHRVKECPYLPARNPNNTLRVATAKVAEPVLEEPEDLAVAAIATVKEGDQEKAWLL
jgi:hypothetical protein